LIVIERKKKSPLAANLSQDIAKEKGGREKIPESQVNGGVDEKLSSTPRKTRLGSSSRGVYGMRGIEWVGGTWGKVGIFFRERGRGLHSPLLTTLRGPAAEC